MAIKSNIGAICTCLAVASFNANAALVEIEADTVTLAFIETSFSGVYGDGIPLNAVYSISDGDPTTIDWFREWDLSTFDSSGVLIEFFTQSSSVEPMAELLAGLWPFQDNWTYPIYFPAAGNYTLHLILSTTHCPPEFVCIDGQDTDNDIVTQLHASATMNITLVDPVPVPPAVWLFGSGLIGLIGIARRKANA